MGLFFDPLYILISLPGLLLGLWAQSKVRSAFNKYSEVPALRGAAGARVARSILDSNGLGHVNSEVPALRGAAGARVARSILDSNGLGHVNVEETSGFLSDHYDPSKKTLRLSPQVYQSNSLAAIGVAAHEAGHALQHSANYGPLVLRSGMVPTVQIGSWLAPITFIIGYLLSPAIGTSLAWVGLILFGAIAVFALVTLPVEFDASKRAKEILVNQGIVSQQEMRGVNAVLDAAALTYVAGAIQAIMTLLYYAFLLLGRSRE